MEDDKKLDWKSITFGAFLGCVLYGYFLAPRFIWSDLEQRPIHSGDNKTAWLRACPDDSIAISGSCVLNAPHIGHLQNAGSQGNAWACVWSNNQPDVSVRALCYSSARLKKAAELIGLGESVSFEP